MGKQEEISTKPQLQHLDQIQAFDFEHQDNKGSQSKHLQMPIPNAMIGLRCVGKKSLLISQKVPCKEN